MEKLSRTFSRVFGIGSKSMSEKDRIYREWDRQRARATGPSDLAEIDEIFSRAL